MTGLCALISFWVGGCAAPRKLWPQKNMAAFEKTPPGERPQVLIAARGSAYKQALVEKVAALLALQQVGVAVVGIDRLQSIQADDFPAVVVIAACLAWGLDEEVQDFIERQSGQKNLIVVATSGSGEWLPPARERSYDALSSASKLTDADAVARTIAAKITTLLEKN